MADNLDGARFCHEASIVTEAARDITPPAKGSAVRSQAANLLSASRFILAIAWLFAFESGYRGGAVLGSIAIAGAISDLVDGRVARRMNIAGGVGRWLDAIADITFVLTALTCEAWSRAIPFYIPALIAISFSQYAIDSMVLNGAPIKSRLGHFGGIINFGLEIVLGLAPPPTVPGNIVRALCPMLSLFYIAAIAERVIGYLLGYFGR
ncbi:MAG TPA: CDP-alcohol phosphatidyltransferase family protein [Candidatus Binataceae bacterium]|nr:CDP-alcohol phosphatidyltransferase family protein [Candidatus Binataceae bacterium]